MANIAKQYRASSAPHSAGARVFAGTQRHPLCPPPQLPSSCPQSLQATVHNLITLNTQLVRSLCSHGHWPHLELEEGDVYTWLL